MSHIFISYSHQDKKYLDFLMDSLKGEGLPVWIDEKLEHGSVWLREIQERIDTCSAFIVIMTSAAYNSDWVQNEVARAMAKKKDIYPLWLEGDIWTSLQAVQCVDVRDGSLPPKKYYLQLATCLYGDSLNAFGDFPPDEVFSRQLKTRRIDLMSPDEILELTFALVKTQDLPVRIQQLMSVLSAENIASLVTAFDVILSNSIENMSNDFVNRWLKRYSVNSQRAMEIFKVFYAEVKKQFPQIHRDYSARIPSDELSYLVTAFTFAPDRKKAELCSADSRYLSLQIDMFMVSNMLYAFMDNNPAFPIKVMQEREKLRSIREKLQSKGVQQTMTTQSNSSTRNNMPLYKTFAPAHNSELRSEIFTHIFKETWFPTLAIVEGISINAPHLYSEKVKPLAEEDVFNGFHAAINLMLACINYVRPDEYGKAAAMGISRRLWHYINKEQADFVEKFIASYSQLLLKDLSGKRLMSELIRQFGSNFGDKFMIGSKIAEDLFLAYWSEIEREGISLTNVEAD